MDFESALNDKTSPIAIDFDENKHVLLIAFGGLANQIGLPMFEFNKLTSGLKNINKIYLRDQNKLWYHRGLPGMGNNLESIATFLRSYTTHQSTHKVVIFGNSGGGYAALLFGNILQADEVHAFAPRTYINPIKRLIQNNLPSGRKIQVLLKLFFYGQKKYFDLKKFFKPSLNTKGNFYIYYPSEHKMDNLHAYRMKKMPRVYLHPYKYDRHDLIVILKRNGELKKIIKRAISLEDLPHTNLAEPLH